MKQHNSQAPPCQGRKLKDLKGKKALLISLPGYRDGIMKKMEELGAKVDLVNDKPNDGFLCKTLGRLQIRCYQEFIYRYYAKELKPLKNRNYDFILVIRGEYTPVKALKLLKTYYPGSRLVLYMWDGLNKLGMKGIEQKWPYYDRVYTFDRIDYEAHKGQISFLPLYYYEEYLPKGNPGADKDSLKYDLSFIGTGHGDRVKIVKEVTGQCEKHGLRCFSYFFMPHPFMYLYNKIFNRDFKNVRIADIKFRMMPFKKLYRIYAASRCVVDIEHASQHGLTMRSIEILGLRRKLITTNRDIVNYDFYNENNICIIDRKHPAVDKGFFEKPYQMLDEGIYEKYSLGNWILEVLK